MKAHYSMYSSIRYVFSGLLVLLLLSLILPKQDLQAQSNYVSFAVAAGVTDVVPHQLVRTNDDRLYIVAVKAQYSTRVAVYWTPQAGLPTTNTFTGTTEIDVGTEALSTDAVYNGADIIHILTNTRGGVFYDTPFNIRTNTVQPRITIATNSGTVSGEYIGTSGITGMIDTTGVLHTVYWRNDKHIAYQGFTYNQGSNVLVPTGSSVQLDSGTSANHPALALSPLDNTITVAWFSDAVKPAKILARTRSTSGVWGAEETLNTAAPWTSVNSGINIDQGPSLVIDRAGTRHLLYIQDYDSTGSYGRVHYVRKAMGDNGWTDTALATYSHDPAVGINSANEVYLIGHGPQQTGQNDDMYVSKRNSDGSWTAIDLFAQHTGGDGFDASPSTKWSVVGWNRPESIEFMFFAAIGGNYNNTVLHYGRIPASGTAATNTPIPPASNTPVVPNTPTKTFTPVPTNTPTLTPSNTPIVAPSSTPLPSATSSSGAQTLTLQINNGADDVNDTGTLTVSDPSVWVGNAGTASPAIAGFRFNGVNIPSGSIINSAHLEFYSTQSQWQNVSFQIAADAVDNSAAFTSNNRPAQRSLTTAAVIHSSNVQWNANTWYSIDEMAPVIQQLTNRAGWQSGNSLSLILTGLRGGTYGRKFASSFESGSTTGARLVINFQAVSSQELTPTSTNTPIPTATTTNLPAPTATYTPTRTPTVIFTNTPTPTLTPTASSGPQTVTFTIKSATDDVNEDGASLVTNGTTIWIGNGGNATASFAGLRFAGVTIPRGATIVSAHLEVYSSQSQWIPITLQMAGDASDNSAVFSTSAKPSQRPLTTARITHNSNVNWAANTRYSLDEIKAIVQEIVSRSGWQSGNSLSLILKGTAAGTYSRKFGGSFEGNPTLAVRLVVTYS